MDFKRIPWVSSFLESMELEDLGGNFWSSRDGSRSMYLGRSCCVVITHRAINSRDYETSHRWPERLDEAWFHDAISSHVEQLMDELVPDDLTLN